jgi:glycerol uptake facilitator-like aquaporin
VGIGTFVLVVVICAVGFTPRARQEWAPFAIGSALGLAVMLFGPLTGGSFNPARWFGPALISDDFGGTWPYIIGPLLGALLAVAAYRFVIAGEQFATGPEPPTSAAEKARNIKAESETELGGKDKRKK